MLLADVYDDTARKRITDGLASLRASNATFVTLSQADRERLLRALDTEATKSGETHWFSLMHELSMKAYFSSELGMTKAMRYVREPGRFNGCVTRTPGQPAWA